MEFQHQPHAGNFESFFNSLAMWDDQKPQWFTNGDPSWLPDTALANEAASIGYHPRYELAENDFTALPERMQKIDLAENPWPPVMYEATNPGLSYENDHCAFQYSCPPIPHHPSYQLIDDGQTHLGVFPGDLKPTDSSCMPEDMPMMPPVPRFEEPKAKPVSTANHPPAKRLPHNRSKHSRESTTSSKSSPYKPRVKKASSFNDCVHNTPRSLRKVKSISKSKSVPHLSSAPTSAPKNAESSNSSRPSFSFINYTVEDGDELISAVAPSGTLKTRARREQEAREEARRLEEAALAAIRKAGGDLKQFRSFLH